MARHEALFEQRKNLQGEHTTKLKRGGTNQYTLYTTLPLLPCRGEASGSIVRWFFPRNAQRERIGSRTAEHWLDEPARLSLGMVVSRQSPPPFHLGKFILAPPRHAVLKFRLSVRKHATCR